MAGEITEAQGDEQRRRALKRSLERMQPPTQVPGYEMERFLGAGAFGEVWVAVDGNTGRRVAIKFYVHRGGLDWSLLNREVEKLAFLSTDRYVVQLMEVGWDSDPPFYVMEYIENGSLEDRLESGPMPLPEAVSLFQEVAIGLVHAHNKGVLHCDLKPGNVLLDQDGKPRLADFGQSRLSHEQTPALGTLFYMAPEQADLKSAPEARWDVYALGALLYRMLTGDLPYRTQEIVDQLNATDSLEDRLKIYRKAIKDAPKLDIRRRLPDIDRSLAEIVERCLDPHPSQRYQNPQAVLEALQLRAMRKARRPLLILGAIGPALLLLVMGSFAWNAFHTAVGNSSFALQQRALESNQFAARFVAETAARDIDRRWRVLEAEVPDARGLLLAAMDKPIGSPEQQALQEWILERHEVHQETTPATSWFINNAEGMQMARSPLSQTIGRVWAHRDYFHGQGKEYPENTKGLKPITEVHCSMAFDSKAKGANRMVAFSVPIRRKQMGMSDPSGNEVIGILAMTVELGEFGEMSGASRNQTQIAALADTKRPWYLPDHSEAFGLYLQHPYLADLRDKGLEGSLPACFLSQEYLTRVRKARAYYLENGHKPEVGILDAEYRDPIGKESPEYQGRMIAAIEPVFVRGRPLSVSDTGWVAIVQEEYNDAIQPVVELRNSLVTRGLMALGLLVAVVTGLWLFVIRVVSDTSRRGLLRLFRPHTGLSTESLNPPTGSLIATGTPDSLSDSSLKAPEEKSGGNSNPAK